VNETPLLADAPSLDLTVIVVSWNTADLLLACLASLAENPFHGDHEIIVVDNASPDGSADRVARSYPRVRLIRNASNEGYSAGNNLAIRRACGRYVLLLNSDTEVRSGTLDRLVRFLESAPRAGAVGPRHVNPDGSLQPSCMRFPTLGTALIFDTLVARLPPGKRHLDRYFMRDFDHRSSRPVDQIPGSCLLMPREVVQTVGLLDERLWLYFNDVDYCQRILAADYSIHFLSDAEVMHHQHASTRKFTYFVVEWHANRVIYYRKYFGRGGALVAKLAGLYVALRHLARLTWLREAPPGSYWNNVRFVVRGLVRVFRT
jgi:N-acetylglucosaminyl-diphospho-decaprenol L-rhamnosyltransferase